MPERICIVDDNPPVGRLVRTCVQSRLKPVVCTEAEDGLDAVRCARDMEPELIFLDLCIPKMSRMVAAAAMDRILPRVPSFSNLAQGHGFRWACPIF